MSEVKLDNDIHSADAWKRDLLEAGWSSKSMTVWEDPEGHLYRGPYRAWCELQGRKAYNELALVRQQAANMDHE